jgi:hypothetical protein
MWGCAATCCKVPDSSRSLALSSRTRQSRSSPARLRESRPTLAPIWNWKHARRRRRESNSSRCATGSSMARAPGTRATAIWAIRLGNGKFRLLARDTASPASCISTMRPERPPPRWSVRWARTTSSTETRRLSTCGCRRSRALRGRLRRLASAKKTRFGRWARCSLLRDKAQGRLERESSTRACVPSAPARVDLGDIRIPHSRDHTREAILHGSAS